MGYANVGALRPDGQRYRTKKELRDDLANARFDLTALGHEGTVYSDDAIQEGAKLSVVGPDPYTNRKWYATVTRKNGKLVIS